MSQFEQENDLGRGGGEVDEETAKRAWRARDERLNVDEGPEHADEDAPEPELETENP